jgi:dTDP-4-dehydrorhamnose reductase
MLRKALANPTGVLRVVNDQYGSPTWSWRLARQIDAVIAGGGHGVYHATAEGYCTWYEFADHFLRCMDVPHRVEPCTTADYPTPARRPGNSILENARLKAEGLNCMRDWRADVAEFSDQYRDRLIRELTA